MQIKKIYQNIKPELLFDELKDLIIKQGAIVAESNMGTYSLPDDSSSFISRGTLIFKMPGKPDKECIKGYIVGSARGETKLMLDIDDSLFSQDKVVSFQEDLDFLLGSYEIKPG
ncbi:MAG: hypothetical protein MUO92_03580 [Dehalococcoidales bacterium]|nr:hypothetical protein [Dehalococcoidales bacterium]